MTDLRPRGPRRGSRALALAAALGVGVLSASFLVTAPAAATDYPSWSDVQAARASADGKAAEVANIQSLITGLQDQVAAAQAAADAAWTADQAAQAALAEGQRKADSLASQADQAKAAAEQSAKRAAALAADFARSAGNDLTSRLVVSGDSSGDLLYQLSAMSKLSEASQGILEKAKQDENTATSLSAQAEVAKGELTQLAAAADASVQAAVQAQQGVQAALIEQEAHEADLTVQLAALQSDSAMTEQQYQAGVEAEKQRKIAAEQAAAAAAAAAQQSGSSGGSSSGGSSGGSGGSSGGGSAPVIVTPPAPSYSGDAVVAFAEQFVGVVPYGWGADPNDSFGCDGLTQYVFKQFGIYLPRTVSAQAAMGVRVSAQSAQAGDLVVWPGQHIGIYDGQGGVIHSPDWGRYVTHASGLWGSFYFVRLL
jgi:peptidoglycan DL-endopeptidase CwlO